MTDPREKGSILLIALWLLVILSGIAVGVTATVRTDAQISRNLIDDAEARHLAQAAINRMVLDLLSDADGERKRAGRHSVDVFGTKVEVSVVDECGKIDLNTAWGLLIDGLAKILQPPDEPVDIGQAILDWRDPDRQRRLKGGEIDDYAGRTYRPRDGVFDSVEELQLVLGMTPDLYARMEPLVTVDCLAAGIDPVLAPRGVLEAVPGIQPAALATFLQAREKASEEEAEALAAPLDDAKQYFDVSPRLAYGLTAEVARPAGGRVAWQAVVWLTGDAARPFTYRLWRQVQPGKAGKPPL